MTDRAEFISKHVPYTIYQLQGTRAALQGLHTNVVKNALIESFCISARALIDFTLGKHGEDAREYTDDYTPWAAEKLSDELTRRLSNQIAHLTLRRTEISAGKLNADARDKLYSAVINEMDQVRQRLKPEFDRWPAELTKERNLALVARASTTDPVTSTSITGALLDLGED